jgi:hypothetical protein
MCDTKASSFSPFVVRELSTLPNDEQDLRRVWS